MTDFYVTLPSNVPNSAFNNTTSRYSTRLPEVLQLRRDEWTVALTDLVYPHSFVNVGRPLHYWVHFKNQPPVRISFPSSQYLDLSHIISTLNRKPQTRMKRAAVEEMLGESKKVKLAKGVVDFLNAEEAKKKIAPDEKEKARLLAEKEEARLLAEKEEARLLAEKEEAKRLAEKEEARELVELLKKKEGEKKKEEEVAKKKEGEKKKEEEVAKKKKEEEVAKKEELRKEEEARQLAELLRKKEEEARRVAAVKEAQDKARIEEEKRVEVQSLLSVLSNAHDSDRVFAEYQRLALDVLNKPKDQSGYRDLLAEFEKSRSLVAIDDPAYDTGSVFHFEEEAGKLKVIFNQPEDILFLEFEKACSYFLGFDDTIVRGSMVAPHNADMFGDVSVIYLYSDLVDPIIVGNKKSSLLSVVPCTGQYGSIVYYTVPSPRYIPLMNSNIDSIRIELLTGAGDPVPFSWGTTVAVLHFKKIK